MLTIPFVENTQYKILFQNFQSLFNKQEILETFLEQNKLYEIICISETWLSPEKIDLINFTGYKMAASFCRTTRRGGGVCILANEHIEIKEEIELSKLSVEYVIEVCAVEIVKENILLIVMYWNGKKENIFYEQLKQMLTFVHHKYQRSNVIIGGDFNINTLKNNVKSTQLIELMLQYKFCQYIKQPTHITPTSSTCLDLIFTNMDKNKFYTSVEELGFSYHLGTVIHLTLPHSKNITWRIKKRFFNEKNIDKFKTELQNINWQTLITPINSINDNYKLFNNTLQQILNKCIPKRDFKIKNKNKKPWLTVGIKRSCHHKRMLKIINNKIKNDILKNHYKKYSKTLKQTITISKKLNYKNRMTKSNNKMKTAWNIINERTNKSKEKNHNNISLLLNNIPIIKPDRITNIFNDYFISIGLNTATNCTTQNLTTPISSTENTMFLRPVSYDEIYRIIKNLKNKSSYGVDELPPNLIRKCADELTLPLHMLVNQSFEEGQFPDSLKIAIIKPIYKKGEKTNPKNYRPIALLPTFSKIFEKTMCDRVYNFCEKYNIFHESQNGFRKKRSTILAVYKYIQEVLNIINEKQYGVGVLLDMTKAYDKIQHKLLLSKLYTVGIRGNCHNWFKSYLENRQQIVEIEYLDNETKRIIKVQSEQKTVNASIPQGSVIGCLLFIIYINDLPNVINEISVLFADDLSVLMSCNNSTNIKDKLKAFFNHTSDWMNKHNLEINFDKTKIITFHPPQKVPLKIDFEYNSFKIEAVNQFTLLGLEIDTHVNWKAHLQKIRNKIAKFTYALLEIKRSTDLQTALSTYYAYAYSWFTYGIIMWGNSTNLPYLFIQQKKLIRILTNIKNTDSCRPHFTELKILTLPCIYILEVSKFVKAHPNFYTKREDMPTKYSLRHKNRLMLPTSRLTSHSTSPFVMSIKIYNKLPIDLKNNINYSKFVKDLKEFLIKKCYYSLDDFLNEDNNY